MAYENQYKNSIISFMSSTVPQGYKVRITNTPNGTKYIGVYRATGGKVQGAGTDLEGTPQEIAARLDQVLSTAQLKPQGRPRAQPIQNRNGNVRTSPEDGFAINLGPVKVVVTRSESDKHFNLALSDNQVSAAVLFEILRAAKQ